MTFKLASHSRFRKVGEEGVLVLQSDAEVVVLNDTGAEILRAVQAGTSFDGIVDALCDRFSVEPEAAAEDARAFLDELLRIGAVEEAA